MAKTALYIYIAVVFSFGLLPVQGENVKCNYKDSILVGEECYRINFRDLQWTEARDDCIKNGGKLATFTSLDHASNVLTTIETALNENATKKKVITLLWIGAENEAEKIGFSRSVVRGSKGDAFTVFFGNCGIIKNSYICTENEANATTQNDLTAKVQKTSTTTIRNDTCIYNDSVPVDGLCFRLSAESFEWSNARRYCESWNGTLATYSSVEQGIQVLTAMKSPKNTNSKQAWISDSQKGDQRRLIKLIEAGGCNGFDYAQLFSLTETSPVLCIEKPLINSDSNPIELSTTTETLISKQDLTTEQLTTRKPESITENESNTTITGQDKRKSTTTSKSTTLEKLFFEMIHMRARIEYNTRIGYNTNDLK